MQSSKIGQTLGGIKMMWEVICDNEWYFEGTYEQCCRIVGNICSDPDFYGGCYMVSEEEFYGIT